MEILDSPACPFTVMAGFDGYVDSILRVCRKTSTNGASYFRRMDEWGDYLKGKSGKSCSLELRLQKEKIGGNMPIFAKALAKLGIGMNCVGAMGLPEPLPLFRGLPENCRLYSVCEPGFCEALEFDDGKVMLARNEGVDGLNFQTLLKELPVPKLLELMESSRLLAFFNWSEMKGSTEIWSGLLREVFPKFSQRKEMFLDLSDCSQRPEEELLEAAGLIREFSRYGRVVLSLNRGEAEALGKVLGCAEKEEAKRLFRLREKLLADTAVLHLPNGGLAANASGLWGRPNLFLERPRLSTGGGDNFNAGFVYALLFGCSVEEALICANAVSGYYVFHGESPNAAQLKGWLLEHKKAYFEQDFSALAG